MRHSNQLGTDTARLRRADQLPPSEHKDLPESPCSPEWERAFEPTFQPPRGEHKKRIEYAGSSTHLPETDLQALMEAAPFEEPHTSQESVAGLREQLADAIDKLEPRLRWIFEARTFRGLSVREVGRELNLSKSYVDRLHRQAVDVLQRELAEVFEDWMSGR